MMKVLLVGGGAREHAVAAALKREPGVKLYAAMKNRNPGIMRLAEKVWILEESDAKAVAEVADSSGIEFAVVGPEAPLAAGLADELEKKGIPCVGPKKAVARIEWDKEFMRRLMERHRIPCSLTYRAFGNVEDAWDYMDALEQEVAVKPVGLTGGKGVKVIGEQLRDMEDAKRYVREVIEKGIGGGRVLIEEKALGEEFTLQAFVDGSRIALMPAVQDHKRAFEGDKGHNTGGMGSYSSPDFLLPFLDEQTCARAGEVMRKAVKALKAETGEGYKGVLYGQFILGRELKLLEFNCRFGDPEAMNVLPLMESSMTDVCREVIEGSLGEVDFERRATVCKYVVPLGYGVKPVSGRELRIDEEEIARKGALLYYASVNEEDGRIYTTSSRSVGVVGVAESIEEAERICEEAIGFVSGEHVYHRRDIGTRELIERKLERLKALR